MFGELLPELLSLKKRAEELTKTLLLSEPADANGAFIEIKAGSGGTEACDWASILSRMYTRWAQAHDFSGLFTFASICHTIGDLQYVESNDGTSWTPPATYMDVVRCKSN